MNTILDTWHDNHITARFKLICLTIEAVIIVLATIIRPIKSCVLDPMTFFGMLYSIKIQMLKTKIGLKKHNKKHQGGNNTLMVSF